MTKILLQLVLLIYSLNLLATDYYGEFKGDLILNDGASSEETQLVNDFTFIDPQGYEWKAEEGLLIDGTSIPRHFWTILGPPFRDAYRKASVVHGAACARKDEPWENVHLMFYYAMKAEGVDSIKAKVMYAAVYLFGPRWPFTKKLPKEFITSDDVQKFSEENKISTDNNAIEFHPYSYTEKITISRPQYSPMRIKLDIDNAHDQTITTITKKGYVLSSIPATSQLSHKDFEALKKLIKEREESETPVTLEEIRQLPINEL